MAHALCGRWNVFAADLQNEPHASSWAKGRATDWNRAAERIGNHVLALCPRWMIFVEGVGYTPGAPGLDDASQGVWWGENLAGVRRAPIRLSDGSRLVYSPHTYGPGVYLQEYFKDPAFPQNMPAVWDAHFGFVQRTTGVPVVIGEIGGVYEDRDREWQDWAIAHAASRGFGLFYFCLNPDSVDTGGLLLPDWTQVFTQSPHTAHTRLHRRKAPMRPKQPRCAYDAPIRRPPSDCPPLTALL